MKRILIAIHALSFDGAEKVAAMWANYLAENGYNVAFLVRYRLVKEQLLDTRIKVYSITESRDEYLSVSEIQRLRSARKIAKEFKPDLIISLLPKMQLLTMLATLGMKCKRFETVRNNPWLDKDVGSKRLLWNICFMRSKRIILQTEEQAEYFPKWMQKKCVVIRNPILKAPNIKRYMVSDSHKFVAVGRISEQKNYPLMIRAFSEATNKIEGCTLDIYGSGSDAYTSYIQQQINTAGLAEKVKLCGRSDHIQDKLLGYGAFLMSSDYEGMPNALAEAMAAGLVCLSTNCKTGPKDMIEHGVNGFLAETGNVQSFADGILKIIRMDIHDKCAMGAIAREKILALCSEENTLERLKQLIETEV